MSDCGLCNQSKRTIDYGWTRPKGAGFGVEMINGRHEICIPCDRNGLKPRPGKEPK